MLCWTSILLLVILTSKINCNPVEVSCELNLNNKFHCIFEDVDFSNENNWTLANRVDEEVNDDVTGFTIKGSNLHYIPNVIFRKFPNLKTFYASENNHNLKILNARNFKGARKLVSFYLNNNEISKLSANNFKEIPNLLDLFLNSNQIKIIADSSFAGLHKLETLTLSHNQLTAINFNTFKGLFSLSRLGLSNNNIKSIDNRAFRMVKEFFYLNLLGNQCIDTIYGSEEELDIKNVYEVCDPKKLELDEKTDIAVDVL